MSNISEREANYDLLRIISTIAVILIHVNWIYFGTKYGNPQWSAEWIVESLINIVTRFSVPCFVMLSGAFVLQNPKNSDTVYFYKKSIIKIFFPTFVVAMLMVAYRMALNLALHKNWLYGIKGIFIGSFFNLWFIYMLFGLYLLCPFIVKLKQNISWRQYKMMAIVMLVWAVISQATSSQKMAYSIGVCFAFVSYFMMGDVIKNEIAAGGKLQQKWKFTTALIIISCICIGIAFCFRFAGFNYYIADAYINFFSPAIVCYSICVFIWFGLLKIKKDYSWLSSMTFNIYLFHTAILGILKSIVTKFITIDFVGEILLLFATFVLSLFCAYVFQKVMKMICEKSNITYRIENLNLWKLME